MSRVFVMGDIHGACRALRQCLERSAFDCEADHLICLGDVSDGWPETKAAVDVLLQIKRLTYILGNHDWWTLEWMRTGKIEPIWFRQGGEATIKSYQNSIPSEHLTFFSNAPFYYIYENRLFVHAGIDPYLSLEDQDQDIFLWDRSLAMMALDHPEKLSGKKLTTFDEVYIGHTPIPYSGPIRSLEVWMMDTGAGWSGVLSMMNIDTKEVFTSDAVPSLYPGISGRTRT